MVITKKMAASFFPTINNGRFNLKSPPRKQIWIQLQARWRELKWIACLFVLTVLLSLVLYHLASLVQPLRLQQQKTLKYNFEDEDRVNLARILREASMEENTVIVTMMNQAYAAPNSTFDVFLEGFRVGEGTERLLRHVVVVCLDEKAYSRCLEVFPRRCFLLRTSTGIDFSREKRFMVRDYLEMMWHRTEFLGSLLKLGYSFVLTDMDTVWLRDPFPRFIADVDFQIACDHFNGNNSDTRNYGNGGFLFVIANRRTINFYNYWYESRLRFPGKNEQTVFNWIKGDKYIKKIGLKMRFLNPTLIGNFCQPDWDITKVCIMHGNCCLGMSNKLKDLRQVLEDWSTYLSSDEGQHRGFRQPMNCRGSRPLIIKGGKRGKRG